MAEETQGNPTVQEGQGQPPQAGAEGNEPSSSPPTQFTAEYVKGLRDEAAKWRTQLRDVEAKLQEHDKAKAQAEKAQLEEQGKFKELAEKAQREAEAVKAEVEGLKEQIALNQYEKEVVLTGTKHGCTHPDFLVFAIAKHAETVEGDVNVEEFVVKFKADNPQFFGQAKPTGPVTAEVGGRTGAGKVDTSKMNDREREQHLLKRWRELKK